MHTKNYECCILGAGPAGLGAAIELAKHGIRDVVIIDKNPIVGGLARTETFGGARFDVGPHRFYTKSDEINRLWHDTLKNDFKPVDRLTRIYYKNKYFNYPIKAFDALIKLGPIESAHAFFSFLATKFKDSPEPETFEEWITQKFGRKLFDTFFKTYTEKVWGIPCSQIGAEWAAQRIKGLDIIQVIKKAFSFKKSKNIKTLVEQFDYPVKGAGQMYEVMTDKVTTMGHEILLGSSVVKFKREGTNIKSVIIANENGEETGIVANHFFNSIPLTHFFKLVEPGCKEEINKAAEALYYREHITVNLLLDDSEVFPDQWIYVHSPDVRMARLANYNNFSKAMVPDQGKTALSAEYFVFQTEELWKMEDDDIKQLAAEELAFLGLIDIEKVEASWVVRETESYPTYYLGFKEHYELLKNELDKFSNLSPIGRGGMYKYNNQDHSTMSGILAARNYLKLPGTPYNIWDVNIDAEYLEGAKRESSSIAGH